VFAEHYFHGTEECPDGPYAKVVLDIDDLRQMLEEG
jgi:hypothetical protein